MSSRVRRCALAYCDAQFSGRIDKQYCSAAHCQEARRERLRAKNTAPDSLTDPSEWCLMFNRALDKHSKLSEDDKQPAIDGAEMFVSQQRSSGQKPARLFVCVAIAALRELQMTSANPQMRTR